MPQLRVALCQVNVTVGAIGGNTEIVMARAHEAAAAGAQLVAFPEMALTGYPVEDLALRRSFQSASRSALDALAARLAAEGLGEVAVVLGYLDTDIRARARLGTPVGAP